MRLAEFVSVKSAEARQRVDDEAWAEDFLNLHHRNDRSTSTGTGLIDNVEVITVLPEDVSGPDGLEEQFLEAQGLLEDCLRVIDYLVERRQNSKLSKANVEELDYIGKRVWDFLNELS